MNPDSVLPPEGEKVKFRIQGDRFFFYLGYFEKGYFHDSSGKIALRPYSVAEWEVAE